MTEYYKNWYKKNRERIITKMRTNYNNDPIYKNTILERNNKYQLENKKTILEQKREYCKKNRKQISKKSLEYYHNNINYYLKACLRNRVNKALVCGYKAGSAVRDLGCSIEFFKQHLESKFQKGMTWENRGKVWHIDHIIPLYEFDLTDPVQFKKAAYYSNLQPLFALENLQKNRFRNIRKKK